MIPPGESSKPVRSEDTLPESAMVEALIRQFALMPHPEGGVLYGNLSFDGLYSP